MSFLGHGRLQLGFQVLPAIGALSVCSWLPVVEAPGCLGHLTST